jgi:hypothetical protein
MKITHEEYFRKYRLSVEQYGELLVALAFHGKKMPDHQKGYDVAASIDGKAARIEVKSKFAETRTGRATVVHCSDNKLKRGGMTHLAVILVEHCEGRSSVKEAWSLTKEQAAKLRRRNTKAKYINVNDLRAGGATGRGEFKSIEKMLQRAASSYA